eukprot:364423-Chlamydomonas_euryale.AAC.3
MPVAALSASDPSQTDVPLSLFQRSPEPFTQAVYYSRLLGNCGNNRGNRHADSGSEIQGGA